MIPYEGYPFCGPYLEKDNYYNIQVKLPSGSWKKVPFHKYLMERHIGRYLESNEQVHHVDKNPMNNEISNLSVLSIKEHGKLRMLEPEPKEFECPFCRKVFTLSGEKLAQLRRNRTAIMSYTGPFCSRSCISKYHNYKRSPQTFICPFCSIEFELSGDKLSHYLSNKKASPGKKGPYCCRQCTYADKVK